MIVVEVEVGMSLGYLFSEVPVEVVVAFEIGVVVVQACMADVIA